MKKKKTTNGVAAAVLAQNFGLNPMAPKYFEA